jgi:hypothetical protein
VIVLDEQLDPALIESIKTWHGGKVVFVNDLRLGSVVKDDVIAQLLTKSKNKPTFITINVKDFWKKISVNQNFSVVCFHVSDRKTQKIPILLKSLFRIPDFKTKTKRAVHIFRIDLDGKCAFYSDTNPELRSLKL